MFNPRRPTPYSLRISRGGRAEPWGCRKPTFTEQGKLVQAPRFELGTFWACNSHRTRNTPIRSDAGPKGVDRAVRKSREVLKLLALERFAPRTLEEFEDWVDKAAQKVTQHRVCCALFQEAWAGVAAPVYARIVRMAQSEGDYESVVNSIGRQLFKSMRYLEVDAEQWVCSVPEQETVLEARNELHERVARYMRLSMRYHSPLMLPDNRIIRAEQEQYHNKSTTTLW